MKCLYPFNKGYTLFGQQQSALRTVFMRRTKAPLQYLGVSTESMSAKEAVKCTETALNIGYKHINIDGGDGHEKEIGNVIRLWHGDSDNKRTDHFYSWKLPHNVLSNIDDVKRISEETISKLNCSYLDMIWAPFPVCEGDEALNLKKYNNLYRVMSDLRPPTAKITRHVGVSDVTPNIFKFSLLRDLKEMDMVSAEIHILKQQSALQELCNTFDTPLVCHTICPEKVSTYPTIIQASKSLKLSPLDITVQWLLARELPFVLNTSDTEVLKKCYALVENRMFYLSLWSSRLLICFFD